MFQPSNLQLIWQFPQRNEDGQPPALVGKTAHPIANVDIPRIPANPLKVFILLHSLIMFDPHLKNCHHAEIS